MAKKHLRSASCGHAYSRTSLCPTRMAPVKLAFRVLAGTWSGSTAGHSGRQLTLGKWPVVLRPSEPAHDPYRRGNLCMPHLESPRIGSNPGGLTCSHKGEGTPQCKSRSH